MSTTTHEAASQAEDTAAEIRSKVAPVGLAGKGLLYAAIGFIAINVAMGSGDADNASQSGAIERVAQAPFGKFLLIGLTVGLVGLVIWKVAQAAAGDPIDGDDATDRAKNGVKGFLYAGSAATAVSILIANWSGESSGGGSRSGGSGGGGKQKAAAFVMDWPGGRWIVMVAGLAVVGYAGYQFYKHVINTGFMDRIRSLDEKKTNTIEAVGRTGFSGRALLLAGVGVFLFVAGVQHDSDEVKGLSGVLSDLAGNTWGQVALWVIAVGTFAYGLFTITEAKYRRAY